MLGVISIKECSQIHKNSDKGSNCKPRLSYLSRWQSVYDRAVFSYDEVVLETFSGRSDAWRRGGVPDGLHRLAGVSGRLTGGLAERRAGQHVRETMDVTGAARRNLVIQRANNSVWISQD